MSCSRFAAEQKNSKMSQISLEETLMKMRKIKRGININSRYRNKVAANKNGYKLLQQKKYELSAAFFLLGGYLAVENVLDYKFIRF